MACVLFQLDCTPWEWCWLFGWGFCLNRVVQGSGVGGPQASGSLGRVGQPSKRPVRPRQIFLASHKCWGLAILTTPALTDFALVKSFQRDQERAGLGKRIKVRPFVQMENRGKKRASGPQRRVCAWAETTKAMGEVGLSSSTGTPLATWVTWANDITSLDLSFWVCEVGVILVWLFVEIFNKKIC